MLQTIEAEATTRVGPVVTISGLTKRYGKTLALDHLDLEVPAGIVFGYLGPNGAGKTTTIRILMGLLRPTEGSAQVLGLDVRHRRAEIQARTGYLPGVFAAYPALTGREYLVYLARLRRSVERARWEELADRLELDLGRRFGELSHGNRQKLGLIQAFMHDPDLLILDEPSTGLDPLVQREFLAMVDEARARGRTVFLSSHVLAEVEAVADRVAILREGRLVVTERLETLKAKASRRLELEMAAPVTRAMVEAIPGVQEALVDGAGVLVTVEGSVTELFRALAPLGIERVRSHEADLEELFLRHYREGR